MDKSFLLPDTPETVIANHLIENGHCKLFVSDDHIIVQSNFGPEELIGYGDDANKIFELLKQINSWKCIVLETEVATRLGDLFLKVRYLTDIYHTLNKRVIGKIHKDTHLLTPENVNEIQEIAKNFEISGFYNINELLKHGFLAFSKIRDQVVSITYTSALSKKYADIGTFTKEGFRGQGLSTASTTLVVNKLLEAGKTPVWSCGDTNLGSLKVSQKLGFKEVSRRKYVILPEIQNRIGSPLLN